MRFVMSHKNPKHPCTTPAVTGSPRHYSRSLNIDPPSNLPPHPPSPASPHHSTLPPPITSTPPLPT